jgi:hypothetical protein
VIKSYQGVEKLIGRDPSTLIPMPRADDPDGFRAVMSKLGMPEAPDKYNLGLKNGEFDPNYEKWARGAFHKAGLTEKQAASLAADNNAFFKEIAEKSEADYRVALESDKQALLAEWRGGHDRMMNSAQMAAKQLGFTPEMIDAIERTVGYKDTMKHFAALGQKMSEDNFVSTASGGSAQKFGSALTPEEAKGQWDAMKADPSENAALFDVSHPGHKAAKEKQTRLFKIMYPD